MNRPDATIDYLRSITRKFVNMKEQISANQKNEIEFRKKVIFATN
jgi:hypothetical protein